MMCSVPVRKVLIAVIAVLLVAGGAALAADAPRKGGVIRVGNLGEPDEMAVRVHPGPACCAREGSVLLFGNQDLRPHTVPQDHSFGRVVWIQFDKRKIADGKRRRRGSHQAIDGRPLQQIEPGWSLPLRRPTEWDYCGHGR